MAVVPFHDNIVVKIKKDKDLYRTATGLFVAGVEQDMTVAEVVAIPEERVYETVVRDALGTPERNPDGTMKTEERMNTLNVGDKILFEKRFHHIYDARTRNRIDHTIPISHHYPADDEYDYYLTSCNDVLGLIPENEDIGNGDIVGELFSIMTPKTMQQRKVT